MRATTLLNRVLGFPGVWVTDVDPGPGIGGPVMVRVVLKARKRLGRAMSS